MTSYFFFGLFGACVKADAATDFTSLGDFGLRKSWDALLATFFEVCSFAGFFTAAMARLRWLVSESCHIARSPAKEAADA